ncbi:MAG: hypothetical protein K1060chlam5_00213 [Candidatus Anoxychlamydiales bacterium]|nr:hypothetical protein [Candidatus Anoxychlamydiales bacterium]
MLKKLFLFFVFILLTGCYQGSDADNLDTRPITNNPNLVPTRSLIPN